MVQALNRAIRTIASQRLTSDRHAKALPAIAPKRDDFSSITLFGKLFKSAFARAATSSLSVTAPTLTMRDALRLESAESGTI
jgi:hypothetical protein